MLDIAPSQVLQQRLYDIGGLIRLPEQGGNWMCFAGKLPDDLDNIPNDVIALFDTTPIVFSREMKGGTYPVHFGLQVQVRSTNYPGGWYKAKELQHHLLATYRQTTDISSAQSFFIQSVALASSIAPIGFDETGRRHVLVFNVTSIIEGN